MQIQSEEGMRNQYKHNLENELTLKLISKKILLKKDQNLLIQKIRKILKEARKVAEV
jgi:hypothetical protein